MSSQTLYHKIFLPKSPQDWSVRQYERKIVVSKIPTLFLNIFGDKKPGPKVTQKICGQKNCGSESTTQCPPEEVPGARRPAAAERGRAPHQPHWSPAEPRHPDRRAGGGRFPDRFQDHWVAFKTTGKFAFLNPAKNTNLRLYKLNIYFNF